MRRTFVLMVLGMALLLTGANTDFSSLVSRIDQLEKRIEVLECSQVTNSTFSGHGSSTTMPFTITSSPWEVSWATVSSMQARPPFAIHVYTANTSTYMGGFGGTISENVTNGHSASYTPPGTYYFKVDSDYWVRWSIEVN